MKYKNFECDLKKINMDEISMDAFHKGLLLCAIKTKENCMRIDEQVKHIANTPYIPYLTTLEHYDLVLNRVYVKNELIKIYKLFINWYNNLDEENRLYLNHFIKSVRGYRGKPIKSVRCDRAKVLSMAKRFTSYVKTMSNFNEEQLITNPFVYDAYVRMSKEKQGRNKHDNSTNEKCDC